MTCSMPIVAIPAGKCPAKLHSSDYNEVIAWAEEVYSIGLKNNVNYLPSALVFFAQQFFDIFGDDYKIICNHINTAYNSQDAAKLDELIKKVNHDKRVADKEKEDRLNGTAEAAEPPKKKRGRPPKPVYAPSQTVQPTQPKEESRKITIKRK